jgi:hypothetical protein
MSAGIRSGVNWMRPNDSASASASVWISRRLRQARYADEQAVPAREQRDQQVIDHAFLTDDALPDLGQQQPAGGGHLAHGVQVAYRIDERQRRRPRILDLDLARRGPPGKGRRGPYRTSRTIAPQNATAAGRTPRSRA